MRSVRRGDAWRKKGGPLRLSAPKKRVRCSKESTTKEERTVSHQNRLSSSREKWSWARIVGKRGDLDTGEEKKKGSSAVCRGAASSGRKKGKLRGPGKKNSPKRSPQTTPICPEKGGTGGPGPTKRSSQGEGGGKVFLQPL